MNAKRVDEAWERLEKAGNVRTGEKWIDDDDGTVSYGIAGSAGMKAELGRILEDADRGRAVPEDVRAAAEAVMRRFDCPDQCASGWADGCKCAVCISRKISTFVLSLAPEAGRG